MRTLIAFIAGLTCGFLLCRALNELRQQDESAEGRSVSSTPTRPAASPPQPALHRPDDLTRIHGIGPVFQKRLQEAGIRTFAELAGAGAERLREIVAAADWQKIEPERWIEEARQLASA